MKAWLSWAVLFLCLGGAQSAAVAQKTPAQQTVAVVVVDAHTEPAQPVPTVRVALGYLDGSVLVTDARDVTNPRGQAWLDVSEDAAQRGDLRIEISGASNLVIYQPADGQVTVPPTAVTIKLLPKGSLLLLGPAQIEAMLRRLSLQNKRLERENREAKETLATAQSKNPDELTAAMTDWAKDNGFAIAEVDPKVKEWAEEIQQRRDQATAQQKALAELALKHYGVAAQLFGQAADEIGASMDEDEKKFLEERRTKVRELVDTSIQSAKAYQLDLKYSIATHVLEQARDRAAAEHGRYPDDAALRSIYLDTMRRAAVARVEEGEIAPGTDSAPLISHSIEDYQSLLHQYGRPEERRESASVQDDLGYALTDQGERSSGEQATGQFAQAVEAYRTALEVRTRADLPQDWAKTENNLGTALWNQGERSKGAQRTELLAQAVAAYRAALEVFTKADHPGDWAGTQVHLGVALSAQGQWSTGAQATDLLAQAIAADRAALEVYSKADTPEDWAETQNDLAIALLYQGERSSGAQATDLLAQAALAFRAALQVYTKTDLPQPWAKAQIDLGIVLHDQAQRSSGAPALNLIAQSVEAYRAALEVLTKADLPQEWAHAENDLGYALEDQGQWSDPTQQMELFARSVEAYRAALEVLTKADLPQFWAGTQTNLGDTLTDEGSLSKGARARDLLAQAAQAYRAALEVFTKADQPRAWSWSETNLGFTLMEQGERSSGAEAKELLAQAIEAYHTALQVLTKEDQPSVWAGTQVDLARTLADQGDAAQATLALEAALKIMSSDSGTTQLAASVYSEKLFRYDRAYELAGQWLKLDASPAAELNMAEADLTTGRFEDCEKQTASIDDAAFPAPGTSMIVIRDTIKMTCQWGAGEKAAARATEATLAAKATGLASSGSDFAGTRHFLASSPAFATGRDSWIALFQSLEDGDGGAMAVALRQLEEVMRH
jgi:tetratricopeptide (TPR) repeat protein